MLQPAPGSFLPMGFFPYGDFGPWTIYTSKRRKVIHFLRAPPTSPPSWLQQRQRAAWTAAAAVWSTMGESEREWWRSVARINHLKITAYNLFIIFESGKDPTCLNNLKLPA